MLVLLSFRGTCDSSNNWTQTFDNVRSQVTDSQRILDSIRRLVRFLRIHDRAAQTQVGLSGAQIFVLHELERSPSLSLSELAKKTLTDQSSVSVVVTRLADAGFITRDRDSQDARRLVLNLTKSGRAVIQRAPVPPQEKVLEVLERFSAADRKRFAEQFERLMADLGESGGAAPMMEFADAQAERMKKKD